MNARSEIALQDFSSLINAVCAFKRCEFSRKQNLWKQSKFSDSARAEMWALTDVSAFNMDLTYLLFTSPLLAADTR